MYQYRIPEQMTGVEKSDGIKVPNLIVIKLTHLIIFA